ncbi:uncharacterized protein LOC142107832 isoform X2 [Mixophyes fleayi]|uniref:uncharacterized protein LOC142107832 isoform X2 n=1 Tax=Mixophyes fleayi TaxID=3061075 RepID=UPI003F4E0A03
MVSSPPHRQSLATHFNVRLVSTSHHAQPSSSQEYHKKVNCTDTTGKKSEECTKSKDLLSTNSTFPAASHEINPQSVNSECSSNLEKAKSNNTDKSSKSATSLGSTSNKPEQLTKPKLASSLGSSSSSGSSNCPQSVPKPKVALNSTSGFSSSTNSGPSTRPKTARSTNNKISTNIAIKNLKSASPILKTHSRSKKNASSNCPRTATSSARPTTTGPSHKLTIIPNNRFPFKNSSSNLINTNQKVPQEIRPKVSYAAAVRLPNVSYAAVCTNGVNTNQFNQNGQQFVTNNRQLNMHTTNVIQSKPRVEPSGVMTSSIVKQNIQALLKLHTNGLSVFQLQKIYLFTFRQPIARKGLHSMKQILLGLKDVVKMQGVGVQMLVFPLPAEDIPSIAANGYLDNVDSLYAKEDYKKDVVSTTPSVSLNKKESTQQQTVSLPLYNDQSSSSGMEHTGGPFTNGNLEQPGHKLQNNQNGENGDKINLTLTGLGNLTGNSYTKQVMCSKTVEEPSHLRMDQELDYEKRPALPQNFKFLSKPRQGSYQQSQGQACSGNFVERPTEMVCDLFPPENVRHYHTNETVHHIEPPSIQKHQQMHQKHSQAETSFSQTNQGMQKANTNNGPEQNASQSSYLPQFILHSSGFSIVPGEQNVPHDKGVRGMKLTVPTADISSSLNDSAQITLDTDNRVLGLSVLSAHTQQTVSDTHSKMLQQPNTHEMSASYTNTIQENTEHIFSQPHLPLCDSHFVAMSEKTEFPLSKSYPREKDSQDRSRHKQMACQFSQSQTNMANTQNTNVLGSSVSSEPKTQQKESDSHIENALQQAGSSSLQPQDKVLHLQSTHVSGQTESSHLQHKVPDPQAINVDGQIVSPQSQQVTNSQVANESKQTGSLLPQFQLDCLQMENVFGQIGATSSDSQQTVPYSQTINAFQKMASPVSQSEHEMNNSQVTNKCEQTKSMVSQSQDKALGLQTVNVSGQIGTPSSHTKQTRNKVQPSSASRSHEKVPDFLTTNTPVEASSALESNHMLDFQNKNITAQTSSQSKQKKSPSSKQKKDKQHIENPEQTTLISSQLPQKAPNFCTSKTSGQNRSTPITKQCHESTTAKEIELTDSLSSRPSQQHLHSQNNTPYQAVFSPVQTVPHNGSGSSSEQEEMKTWQTDKEQSCCIL